MLLLALMAAGILSLGAAAQVTKDEFDGLAKRVALLEARVKTMRWQFKELNQSVEDMEARGAALEPPGDEAAGVENVPPGMRWKPVHGYPTSGLALGPLPRDHDEEQALPFLPARNAKASGVRYFGA